MNTKNWIKRSEREPREADMPAWLHNANASDGIHTWFWAATSLPHYDSGYHFTHWMSGMGDIPAPPKEETRGEKDQSAFIAYHRSGCGCSGSSAGTGWDDTLRRYWHAALAHGRGEVAGLLPCSATSAAMRPDQLRDAIEKARARCTP